MSSSGESWWMPMKIISELLLNSSLKITLEPDFPVLSYIISPPIDKAWLILDIEQGGYYRVIYEDNVWQKILDFMFSSAYKDISVINRAKLIDDAFYFAIKRQLKMFNFWELVNYLRNEDFAAWYPLIKIFEYISNIIPFHIQSNSSLKRELQRLLKYPFESQIIHHSNLEKILAQEIAQWACIVDYEPCFEMAQSYLLLHLENNLRILPGWRKWTYCNGLLRANTSVWQFARDKWLIYDNYEYLPYLACTRNFDFILEWFLYALSAPEVNRTQDIAIIRSCIHIFYSIIAIHANNRLSLMAILLNLGTIKPKQISTLVALTDIINHVYSTGNLIEIRDNLKHLHLTEVQISLINMKVQTRIDEIKSETNYFQFLH